MTFTPFELLEWQGRLGATATHSLADSGCRPIRLRDLVDSEQSLNRLLDSELSYPPTCGTTRLRALIAQWHAGSADHASEVIVTAGAAEANTVAVETLIRPGDHVVTMSPGYRQVWGAARNQGAVVEEFPLDPQRGWRPDIPALADMVRPDTRAISVTNPNNPAGIILTDEEMDAIVSIADRVGAWILSDEVHRGTELRTEAVSPTFRGRYDRVVCVGSLSKAFGMPGLRLGWLITPPVLAPRLRQRHEYTTVSAAGPAMALAELALAPATRTRLLDRYRGFLRESWTHMHQWVASHDQLLSVVPPQATSLAFVRYHLDELTSTEVAEALHARGGVLVAPGAHFGTEHHLRFTYGQEPAHLLAALEKTSHILKELSA
ncbi:aminotransferase class I/II-fold pyridoxal phosphate-dependent enzyme [Streptomyces sp. SHP 1-2]|uniref:aminotransferase class I/II-fold pyridoxal phosphate-dependent enzyme n=1 Tax=Streptomyces sp. SHP 1-2 TaxID=2769489 RepID=UPI0022387489|nr:aminotransferase class I/II-fold pyridoxal phosphate-dependent enzyme [Streptomyces sp. SHP 1-2]MCW5254509.1 aminotransferase class I/II-fold pyridoxal phosphate-dependent enzyme [Streptomyces sp. SHP 1-2]